jgi:hypothetical protein
MKRLIFIWIAIIFAGCSGNPGPDVSGIKVELEVVRFERELFAIDTTDVPAALERLYLRYPGFGPFFTEQILGIPKDDRSDMATDAMRRFLRDYRGILDLSGKRFDDLSDIREELLESMRHIRHYFPTYPVPERLYTFIGPLDAYAEGRTGGYGDIIMQDGLGTGLQLHLGADEPIYHTREGLQLYPEYISRRFTPEMIAVNCTKNMIDDLFPGLPGDRNLLDIMIDKGKRMYLLDLFMPDTPDTLKTGYTSRQLEGAVENEALIWNFFLQNELLYISDPVRIRDFIGDGPMTMELGEGSPGHISLFTGRQIIRAYMKKFPDTRAEDLLKLDAKRILQASGYRPRS